VSPATAAATRTDMDTFSTLENYANIAFLAVFGLGLLLVVYGTFTKTKWGINLRRVACPNCGTEQGRFRAPASGKQAMWGGHTCPTCHCEMDKWGRRATVDG
jgi:hypothetical protein